MPNITGPNHRDARRLFIQHSIFIKSASRVEELPQENLPEVAFIGRSNVGKSSVLNALTHQKRLAKTSNTPGRTQLLNIFSIANVLTIVDMPGYGYAKAPKAIVEAWQRTNISYIKKRPQLKRVYILIDSRHGIKPIDEDFCTMLDGCPMSYQLILTKVDKITQAQKNITCTQALEIMEKHGASYPEILCTSSKNHEGIEALQEAILHCCL